MADDMDVDDVPTTAPKAKGKDKAPKGDDKGSKKKFEVKKVSFLSCSLSMPSDRAAVERSSTLGMGHCRGQLRHLQEPYHGSL
jgi:hypothetical protein